MLADGEPYLRREGALCLTGPNGETIVELGREHHAGAFDVGLHQRAYRRPIGIAYCPHLAPKEALHMSQLATAPAPLEDDDSIFSADADNLPITKLDGRRATKLDVRFSGSGLLDRTSEDDLALLEAMRLGAPVRLIVVGQIAGKSFRLRTGDEEELSYSCTVRVESVEAGELA